MLENNVMRVILFISSVFLIGLLYDAVSEYYPELKNSIETYFSSRVQKF